MVGGGRGGGRTVVVIDNFFQLTEMLEIRRSTFVCFNNNVCLFVDAVTEGYLKVKLELYSN